MKKLGYHVATAFLLLAGWVNADEIPAHLKLAREIADNVKPEKNVYSNSNSYVKLPTDFLSSDYEVHTDCGGFVEEVLRRTSGIEMRPPTRLLKDRHSIVDYVDAVDSGAMFVKLTRVQDLKPGDLIMWKFLDKKPGRKTRGHVQIVDAPPHPLEKTRIDGLTQWKLPVVDTSSHPTSPIDRRYTKGESAAATSGDLVDRAKQTGAGRGYIHVYTDKDGLIQAVSYGFKKSTIWYQDKDWRIVMARPHK